MAIPADRRAALVRELALDFAKQRTHGNVYMNGSHNPLPSEIKAAGHFLDAVEHALGLSQEEFDHMETLMGYPPQEGVSK